MQKIVKSITKTFPFLVIIFALLAFWQPQAVIALHLGSYVSWLLGIVMLGMGLTMSLNDFKLVFTKPYIIIVGIIMRSILMPLIAFTIAHILRLPDALAVGLILVGCCPSGTSSNVMTFIARGDTALSVTLTSIITVLSPLLTPFSFYLLAGKYIEVDLWSMFYSILTVVILPVAMGVILHIVLKRLVKIIQPLVPVISIIAIILIILAVVAGNADNLASVALIALIAVIMHNCLGYIFGYGLSRIIGLSETTSRAITFEIGMENSGLAVVLASAAALNPLAAVPGAIFSVWHNFSGSLLAGFWANRSPKK